MDDKKKTIKISFSFETEAKVIEAGGEEQLTIQLPSKITRLVEQLEKEFRNKAFKFSYV